MENYLSELFERDLLRLKAEVEKFNDEANIWKNTQGVTNPAGVLVKHLLGNLNYTIGAMIGKNGYVRNRENEFSLEELSRQELVAQIERTIEVVKTSLNDISQAKLEEQYPLVMFGEKSTAYYLMVFSTHFNYHLGQINYLRRILEAA